MNRPIYSLEDGHFVSSNSFKVCLKIRFSKDFLLFQSGITPLFKVGIRYFLCVGGLVCGWFEV